jgi:hypothetical protein
MKRRPAMQKHYADECKKYGRVATEAAWLNGKNERNCGKSRKNY